MNNFIDFLRYINWCYSGIKDKDWRKRMMKFKTDDCLMIEHNGSLYPNQLIYVVKVKAEYSGFFSMMNRVMTALTVADRYGLKPVIDMGESRLYSEPSMVAAGIPLYEYYFNQPTEIRLDEVDSCCNVTYAANPNFLIKNMIGNYDNYSQESDVIQKLASMTAKYIHLNAATEEYISKNIKKTFIGKKILGVHIRGTDFKTGFKNHAIYVTPEEYIEHVKRAMDRYHYDQIFLATDEKQTIIKFKDSFGDMIACHDVYRAEEDSEVGIHCTKCDRDLHHYKLGLEVLLDMYSLARCTSMIACPSGVSFYALINKRAKGEKYEYMDIIDKGRYKSRKKSNVEIKKVCS